METAPVLKIADLTVASAAPQGRSSRELVKSVELTLFPGEMIGLVGESGSGKSVTASAILGLLPSSLEMISGVISLNGKAIHRLPEKEKRSLRGREMAYIMQNYQGSFTPFRKIGYQLVEALRAHHTLSFRDAKEITLEWLEKVLLPPERVFASYPFQLSGGQLQRTSLAASLMLKPPLIIADEPTTALDTLSSKQVLDLLSSLQKESNSAVLLISHDLTHVLNRTDRIAVMYGGRLIETGPTENVRRNPLHPYTKLFLNTRPKLSGDLPNRLAVIPGEPGAVAAQGCPFSPRCIMYNDACMQLPDWQPPISKHSSACHFTVIEGGDGDEAAAGIDKCREVVRQ